MGLLKLEALARLWSLLKTCTRGQLHGLLLTSSLPGLPALLVRRATDAGDMARADLLFSSDTAPPDAALFNAMILLPRPPRARAGPVRGNAAQGPRHRRVGSPTRTSSTRLRTRRRYGEQLHCRVLNHVQAVASSLLTFYLPGGSGSLRRLYDGLRVKAAPFPNPRKPSSAFPLPSPPPPPPAEAPATEAGAALSSAPSSSRLRRAPSSRYHEGGSGFGPQHHHRVARRPRLVILSVADASDMLPGLSPPPPLVLMGFSSAPSLSPSATQSSSIGASIAIIAAIIIAVATLTCCIVILRLSSCRRRMSGSSSSRRRSISPKASLSAESEKSSAAAAAVGASIRVNASSPKNAEVYSSGLEVPVPSAPCLPEGERVIMELLSQSPVLVQPGSSMFCCFCGQVFVPTDMIVALPVCSHKFHQLCIVAWILRPADSCPFCDTPITTSCADKTSLASAYSSDQYDIEAMMIVPAPPGEEVTEAVGGSRGWLRSSLDRLSGRWRGCSSNHATAVVVPVSSQHTTKSWRLDNMGHLGTDLNGVQMQSGEEVEAVGGSRGWLRSYLATLSSTWSGRSDSRSTTVVLPMSSGRATGSLSLVPISCGNTDSWSRSWDLEASEKRT